MAFGTHIHGLVSNSGKCWDYVAYHSDGHFSLVRSSKPSEAVHGALNPKSGHVSFQDSQHGNLFAAFDMMSLSNVCSDPVQISIQKPCSTWIYV